MTCKIDYTANGSIVAFPFPFAIPANNALEVRVNGSLRDVGFRINCAGSADGGVVVFDNAPANGDTISLRYLGAVTIGVEDAAAGHLTDKLVAGDGVSLSIETAAGGVQRLRIGAVEPTDMLKKSENLADIPNKEQACENLGVYTKEGTAGAINTAVSPLNAAVSALNVAVADVNDTVLTVGGSVTTLSNSVTTLGNTVATLGSDLSGLSSNALLKANNLADVADKVTARSNLGLNDVAYLNAAQDWSQPQRSQARQIALVGGSVALDFSQYQNFDLTLTAAITFANPTLTDEVVGQKGTIGIIPAGFAITTMGANWKRVGEIGSPSAITGYGRIDYHIRSTSRIEYAYNDVEV